MQENSQPTTNLPKDGKLIVSLMKAIGIAECEPQVIPMLLEIGYRHVVETLNDAALIANHVEKDEIDINCMRYAIQTRASFSYSQPPSMETLKIIASQKNAIPLPLISQDKYIHLPPDEYCMYGQQSQILSISKTK